MWFLTTICTSRNLVDSMTILLTAFKYINSTLRYVCDETFSDECEFAARAEGEWCNHTCQENVCSHEYRTQFYITRCENADFRTRSVRKTAFTRSEWYKITLVAILPSDSRKWNTWTISVCLSRSAPKFFSKDGRRNFQFVPFTEVQIHYPVYYRDQW